MPILANANNIDTASNVNYHPFITDAEPPMIFNTPSSQNVNTDADSATATVLWIPPVASDNSGIAVTLTSNLKPGDSFKIGNTTVVYTAVDVFGNTATDAFDVVVRGKFCIQFQTWAQTVCVLAWGWLFSCLV